MKRSILALAGALSITMSAAPAFAATSLDVPIVASAPSLDPHAPSAFGKAGSATLAFDSSGGRVAEPADVHVVRDNSALYVRFDVPQSEQLVGLPGGDSVAIDLWPGGSTGQRYHLGVGLDGKHTDDSTANTAGWDTAAASYSGGYTVTMKIPLDVLGSSSRVQFSRWLSSTGELQLWSHDGGQTADDLAQAGTLSLASAVGKN
ncbi:MAG TPA: hypothetical protein VGG89_12250 [Candidatus Baltobacteraceae bacterium]